MSTVMERLASRQPVWVIDPVDGTANFAQGREDFAVMLALVEHDAVLAGWIYEPVTDRMSYAVRGGGAFLDGRPLARPGTENSYRGVLAVGSKGDPALAPRVQKRRDRVHPVKSVRCAGVEYMRLALGELDFLMFSGTMPWDHAAGVLLFTESGGEAALMATGAPYGPADLAGELLLAPDRARWNDLRARLIDPA